jgi:hypothetical protein
MRVSLAAVGISLICAENGDDMFGDLNFDELMKEDFLSEDWSAGSEENRKQAGEANARRDFDEFDANKDRQLDPLEVRSRFKSYLNEQDLYYFYDNADKDRSGTVSLDEYLGYVNLSHEQYKSSGDKKL